MMSKAPQGIEKCVRDLGQIRNEIYLLSKLPKLHVKVFNRDTITLSICCGKY
jgi:hypothetical protein